MQRGSQELRARFRECQGQGEREDPVPSVRETDVRGYDLLAAFKHRSRVGDVQGDQDDPRDGCGDWVKVRGFVARVCISLICGAVGRRGSG